ncbi:hypothetical protein ACOIFP_005275 [Escherichia coli]
MTVTMTEGSEENAQMQESQENKKAASLAAFLFISTADTDLP